MDVMDDCLMGTVDDEEITQDDAWEVIRAYFEENGLVRQQLDSFDEFIQNTLQEIVNEYADIEIRLESQHSPSRQSDFFDVRLSTRAISCTVHWMKRGAELTN